MKIVEVKVQNLEFLKKNKTSKEELSLKGQKEREVRNNLWHKRSINMELALES